MHNNDFIVIFKLNYHVLFYIIIILNISGQSLYVNLTGERLMTIILESVVEQQFELLSHMGAFECRLDYIGRCTFIYESILGADILNQMVPFA